MEKVSELWRPVPGWETRYEASSLGRVRSKDMVVRAKGGAAAVRKGRVLQAATKTNGYLAVTLTDGVNRPQVGVHVIVARTFKGPQPAGLSVLHGDGDKRNNTPSNLRYGTQAENNEDTRKHGRSPVGARNGNAQLDEDAVRHIRASGKSTRALAELYKVHTRVVWAARRGRTWRHVGDIA